jgi:hypothetical protein
MMSDKKPMESVTKITNFKYKVSSFLLVLLLSVHISLSVKETVDYVNSYQEKHKMV